MSTEEITIRSIQHFMYCPHRWGLMEIDCAWAENAFVTKANLMHNRVHDPDRSYTLRGKRVLTSVPVYNDLQEYNLYGVTDCIELTEDEDGVPVSGVGPLHKTTPSTPHEQTNNDSTRYKLCIVEYKPTKPKNQAYRDDDLMQVFAQKICVDFIFGCDCEGVLYYADVKQKVQLPLQEHFAEYDEKLKTLLQEMRSHLQNGEIPSISEGQNCSGCSMKDMCLPDSSKHMHRNLHSEILRIGKESLE